MSFLLLLCGSRQLSSQLIIITMFNDQSFFGSDFKYVLILTLLAWMSYTLPPVRAALETPPEGDPLFAIASSLSLTAVQGESQLAQAYPSPSPAPCPSGFVCVPANQYPLICKTASLTVSVDPASPAKRVVQISESTTTDVVLAVYDVTSQGLNANLRSLAIGMRVSKWGATDVFSDIRLKIGSQTYSASSVGTTTYFRNLSAALPAGQIVPMVITGVVKPNRGAALNGTVVSTALQANSTNVRADDGMNNIVSVTPASLSTNDIVLSSGLLITSTSAAGTPIYAGSKIVYEISFSFTATAGESAAYLDADPKKALIANTIGGYASTTWGTSRANPAAFSGDTASSYMIPPGTSRTFTYTAALSNGAPGSSVLLQVIGLAYRTTAATGTVQTTQGFEYLAFRGQF